MKDFGGCALGRPGERHRRSQLRLSTVVALVVLAITVTGTSAPLFAEGQDQPLHGDLNGDGILDRVTLGGVTGACTANVELGDGAGGYRPPETHTYQVPFTPGYCPDMGVIVDLGGDGVVELVLAWFGGVPDMGAKDLLVLRDYVPVNGFSAIYQPSGIGVADFNGDGLQDVYEWTDQADGFRTYLNTSGSQLVPGPIQFGCLGKVEFDLADFDQDGGMDVVLSYLLECDSGGSGVVVLYGDGSRTDLQFDGDAATWWSVQAVEADGVGVPDVRTLNGQTGEITHFLSNGDQTFTTSPTAVDDFVQTRRRVAAVIEVLKNDAATTTATVSLVAGPQYGHITLTSPGTFTYVRDEMHNRIDTFVYQISQDGRTDTATVTVSVKG